MKNIIYLSQNHAKNMTDMKGLVAIYRSRNVGGKFDEAINLYSSYYDELMDQVLDR
jgi:hypothetical protein